MNTKLFDLLTLVATGCRERIGEMEVIAKEMLSDNAMIDGEDVTPKELRVMAHAIHPEGQKAKKK